MCRAEIGVGICGSSSGAIVLVSDENTWIRLGTDSKGLRSIESNDGDEWFEVWVAAGRPSATTNFPITVNAENFYLEHYLWRLTLM